MSNIYSSGYSVSPKERFSSYLTSPSWLYVFVHLDDEGNYCGVADKYASKAEEADEAYYFYLVETFGPDHPEAKELEERFNSFFYDSPIHAGPYEA